MGLTNAELGLVLTTVAGSATALGAAVVFSERLVQLASKPFLAGALGLSSGVMLYVSFVEIFVKSLDGFADSSAFGDSDAYLMATAALFGGMGFMSGLDALVHWLDPNRSAHHASDPRKHMVSIAASFFLRCSRRWRGLTRGLARRWRASEAATPRRHRCDALREADRVEIAPRATMIGHPNVRHRRDTSRRRTPPPTSPRAAS